MADDLKSEPDDNKARSFDRFAEAIATMTGGEEEHSSRSFNVYSQLVAAFECEGEPSVLRNGCQAIIEYTYPDRFTRSQVLQLMEIVACATAGSRPNPRRDSDYEPPMAEPALLWRRPGGRSSAAADAGARADTRPEVCH